VLEFGSGSGWLAAVMARLVGPKGQVTGIELIPDPATQSRANLAALGISNVEVITGDGTRGMLRALPATAPSSPPLPETCPRPCWTRLPRAASAWCRSSCVAATAAQVIRRPELVQHGADAPSLVLAVRRRQSAPDGLVQAQAQQRLRHVLLDMGDAQAARQDDAAHVRVGLPRDAAQQR
jgi:SAM-dependent methyltransferase